MAGISGWQLSPAYGGSTGKLEQQESSVIINI
jgi:hypothetical protein